MARWGCPVRGLLQRSSGFFGQGLVTEDIVSGFLAERLELLIQHAVLDGRRLYLLFCFGGHVDIMRSKPRSFECRGDLLKHDGFVSLASIDRSGKLDTAFRKALLPVLALNPHTTHRTLIHAGHLQRLSHVAGGTGLWRENQQDGLGGPHDLAQGLSCVLGSLSAELTAAPKREAPFLQGYLQVREDRFLSILVRRGEQHERRGGRSEGVASTEHQPEFLNGLAQDSA